MKIHFEQEVANLNRLVATQATAVEEAVRRALLSITTGSAELALFVIEGDDTLDTNEIRIEEECLKVLALYQPVASDLRYVITLLKVNAELERIGDLAVNIAERAMHLLENNGRTDYMDFTQMFQVVSQSLKKSLDSLVCRDSRLADEVIQNDDVIDGLHRQNLTLAKQMLRERPSKEKDTPVFVDAILDFVTISRNLERIGDGCTNIGEDIIYLEQGRIVRHYRPLEQKET
ncbi:MAG: phosphate signaling complex protein PhoU [Planctomycetia bacterium]|nr:phosphate signaling complex protein PhoU [Planctomycetia bacterium]